ncbi:unnamed protein product [Effrenium voratum]|uniref:Uncharacterized protein n=1 Tax=Effrenium voratum TaxID=2562239 RepID=A0AA36HL79_9DINO|nr:unnamed protein product [Effrenium voratum]CAJ1432330.1 unnamed protein product [Effrenium voratum]
MELCRLLQVTDIAGLVSQVRRLSDSRRKGMGRASPDTAEMVKLARGALAALEELHGALPPEKALEEVQRLCMKCTEQQASAGTLNLRMAELAETNNCQADLLQSLASAMRCSTQELLPCAEALVKLCDEHVAAHRIVTLLQNLLYVQNITDVLPALKEVLDVAALRQKVLACKTSSGNVDLEAGGA